MARDPSHIFDCHLPACILRAGGEGIGAALRLAVNLGMQGDALASQYGREAAGKRRQLPAHDVVGVLLAANAGERERGHHKAP